MKNLFQPATCAEIQSRLENIRPGTQPLWGKMSSAQAFAHCAVSLQLALGDLTPPRAFIGRILGSFIKPFVFRDDAPIRRNAPTIPELVIQDSRDLATERNRLLAQINRFASAGPSGCTHHPHSFFGPLTPQQWSILMYKHLDHHLRQFGA